MSVAGPIVISRPPTLVKGPIFPARGTGHFGHREKSAAQKAGNAVVARIGAPLPGINASILAML
jgi:hypothetical protein